MNGTRIGPYVILGSLGAGGMGEVYRARDERLARDVAIKILPDAWLADPDRRSRFDREARLLAQLSHPNVGTIYGLEDHGEISALVLELVDGPTLEELLDRCRAGGGQPSSAAGLPIDEVLSIGRQIASALEATHERGIVHRDLKPANIKVTRGGTVKVIDFGLARDVSAAQDGASAQTTAATHAGVIIGTPAYMSPEQARGKTVDKRSDIWSFGCVLYEMLTGRSPFHGDSVADALAAVLTHEPDWRGLPSPTPPNLERLLRRCLEKDHTRRLRDIGEARLEFEAAPPAPATPIAPPAQPLARPWVTLVVLPFSNLSKDPDQEYFSDGLTDETIAAIGEMNPDYLRVVARTSSMAYKKTTKTAAQIGAELRADYLVESTVRREAERVRITTQLIRVEDETQVWSARFDRTSNSVLGVQDEIGRSIASQVHGALSRTRQERAARPPAQDPQAYDLYLRGKYHSNRVAMPDAIAALEAAVKFDPSYAPAWAELAWVYAGIPISSDTDALEYLEKSRHAAATAIALNPQLAEAQGAAGWVEFFLGWRWPQAEQSLRRAIELNPNYAMGRFYLAHLLSNSFRHDEAIDMIHRARDLDPLSPLMHSFHAQFLFDAGRYGEALEPIQRAIAINPHFFHGHEVLSRISIQLGDLEKALDESEQSYRLSGGMLFAFARKGYVLAKMGRRGEAVQILAHLHAVAAERYVAPLPFALVHAGLDHREETLSALELAVDRHAVHLVLAPTDPVWDPFRAEPRFQALSGKCGFNMNRA